MTDTPKYVKRIMSDIKAGKTPGLGIFKLPNAPRQPTTALCKHPLLKKPVFDAAKAKDMTSLEVRRTYPRMQQMCSICKQNVTVYASSEHMVAGDW